MRERRVSLQTVGGTSLLTILAILVLVTFALLSLSTVQPQRSLAEASALAVEGYYRADAEAEEYLAALRQKDADGIYKECFPISDVQSLEVAVSVEHGDYEILRWQVVSTADWSGDDRLDVWSGDFGNGQ